MTPDPIISTSDWATADLVFRLLAVDPQLGGVTFRMRASPSRDQLLAHARDCLGSGQRIHPTISDDQLFGGLDISTTLSLGALHRSKGLLEKSGPKWLTMAERCPSDLAAKLAQSLDAGNVGPLIAIDEGADAEEAVQACLRERLAFALEPTERPEGDYQNLTPNPADLSEVLISEDQITVLTSIAAGFGITSLRAPIFAIRCARAHACLSDRQQVSDEDLTLAAALVFAHRATMLPQDEAQDEADAQSPPEQNESPSDGSSDNNPLDADMMIDAVAALVPPDILAGLNVKRSNPRSSGSGAGSKRKGNRRGRPLPSRAGRLDGRQRLDVVATLRAAAPWQTIRRRQTPDRTGLLLRPSDFRIRRFETKSDRLLVFAVDASGSAAVARLNEAKGTIEHLLADAYASRDHVALISFRGTTAEILLSPTRSLVQAKRQLSSLPGGGGTPLATGMKEGLGLALQARGRGLSPVLVLLTDGRGNIALDGTPDRARANEDATQIAKAVLVSGVQSLVVDTAARPQPALRTLAQQLDAPYIALPRASADRLTGAIEAALPSG